MDSYKKLISLRDLFIAFTWVVFLLLPLQIVASEFSDAQQAAQDGRYRDVIDILTGVLEEDEVDDGIMVTAYSNRGIAYSLLKAYGLARVDLNRALALDAGHALTLNHLGLLAEQVDLDYVLAASYYELAVQQNFAASQVNLANLYRSNEYSPQYLAEAHRLFQAAANQNYSMAYVPLGEMLANGYGVRQDTRQAFNLFKKAVEAGIIDGHYFLGVCFEKGMGTRRNLQLAMKNYRIAAMQGHGKAQDAIGYMYRRGLGVEQDFIEAATWYKLASEQGNASAKNRLAWLLAGCPVVGLCNGDAAVLLALEAIALDADPGFRDSLAAAYARTGQFDLAINTLESLLAELPENQSRKSVYQNRLLIYNKGIPLQLK